MARRGSFIAFVLPAVAGMGEGQAALFSPTRWRFREDQMRKLIVSEFITLDGVIQSPGYPGRVTGFTAQSAAMHHIRGERTQTWFTRRRDLR